MGAWEKLQLGWLDYQQVNYGFDRDVKIGPADRDSKTLPQALLVNLPDKTVTTAYNTPHGGSYEWWGGSADDLNSTLTRGIDLTGKTSASISAWLQYNIEKDYDYLYAEVSTDGGSTWAQVGGLIDGPTDNPGLTPWAQKTWDLTPYAGKNIQFRFRYQTDGGLHFEGPFLDDIAITADGANVLTDTVETGDQRLDRCRRLHAVRRLDQRGRAALLPRREPGLQRLRQDAPDRPVQLRLGQHPS